MRRVLIKGRFAGQEKISALLVVDGIIAEKDWQGQIPEATEVFDFGDSLILPAFIDPHVHGGGGFDFIDKTKDSFESIMALHRAHGTTVLCPTLTASNWTRTVEFLKFCDGEKGRPGFGGVHLEGPFLSPIMSGAQNKDCILLPSAEKAEELKDFAPILKRITVAPELEGARAFSEIMKSSGVSLSMGHSAATGEIAKEALKWGFDQVTHLYCSSSQRYKDGSYVKSGLIETALTEDSLTVELIADGHHICRETFLIALRCKGPERIAAVSDAMRAAGLPDTETESYLGEIKPENRVILEDGVAKLPDRSSFAGSITLGDRMFRALCGRYGLEETTVSRMMSETPARMLGMEAQRGSLEKGKIADITVLDDEYRVRAVFVAGNKA